jgi:hypothetical protein
MINITYIYLVENIDNNPYTVYIGKTKNPKDRENKHKLTYGNNISYTVIDEVNSLEKIKWKPIESYWIRQFKCWGFNIINKNEGGGGPGYQTEETKQRLRKPNIKGRKPRSKGTGDKISQAKKGYIYSEERNIKLRKPKPAGTGLKISQKLIGQKRSSTICNNIGKGHNKCILQYDLKYNFIKEWSSQTEIELELNIRQSNISACCKGIQKTSGGFIWKYKIP